VAAVLVAASCAGQGDIDRTQPDKVAKSLFFNEDGSKRIFYYRNTIIGVPPTSAQAFEGVFGSLEKVRFEIAEDHLMAYRAYDYSPGSENDITGGNNNRDTPIVAFPIKSHFDVKRDYNAATGEQSNVISENSTDRPWHEREYMRVDWSNAIRWFLPDDDSGEEEGKNRPKTVTQDAYGEGDITSPFRPIVTRDYIDATSKVWYEQDYATCYYEYNDIFDDGGWDCGPAEITVRHSFLPVNEANDYEPLEYPDLVPLKDDEGKPYRVYTGSVNGDYGDYACTPAFLTRAASEGVTASDCKDASAQVFEKFGFFRTIRQSYDRKAGVTVNGRKYFANRWNIWDKSKGEGGKSLKFADRKVKPIVYYKNVEWPDEPMLSDAAKTTVDQWNVAFQRTAAGLILTEGKLDAITLDEIDAKAKTLEDIVVLRENTCAIKTVKDHVAKHKDLLALAESIIGDSIDKLSKANLVQVCSALEATTEKLADGNAKKFAWQRNGDLRYSFFHWVDRPQASGPLGYGPSSADPETGEIISAALYEYGASLDTYVNFAVDTVLLMNSSISVDDIVTGKTIADVVAATKADRARRESIQLTPEAIGRAKIALSKGGDPGRLTKSAMSERSAKLKKLEGTALEASLLTPEILEGILPHYHAGEELDDEARKMASLFQWLSPEARERRRARDQKLAMEGCVYKAEFADDAIMGLAMELASLPREEMFNTIRKNIFLGLAQHEMGHTLGLRHNFSGSYDALNFFDQFWDIKLGETDKQKQDEMKISEYQYSTVMDYGARFNSDIQGLGKYDYAAIRFGYGQLVDVMPGLRNTGEVLSVNAMYRGYEEIPNLVGGKENIAPISVQPFAAVLDDLKLQYGSLSATRGGNVYTGERPYKFCSDEYRGSMECKTWDHGANQEEIVNNAIDLFQNYYWFNAFERGRLGFSPFGYLQRVLNRYFLVFGETFQYMYFWGQYAMGYELGQDMLRASMTALNELGRVIQQPEPGTYCVTKGTPNLLSVPYVSDSGNGKCVDPAKTFQIGFGEGKPFSSDYSDGYYYRVTRAGAFYEKIAALVALTDTQTSVRIRVDETADPDQFSINYYRIFKDEMLGLLDGLIRDDSRAYAGVFLNGKYTPVPVIDPATYGQLPTAQKPEYLTATRVESPWYRTLRRYSALFAFANLDSRWDSRLDLATYMTVSLKGSDDDIDYNVPGASLIEVTHPVSRQTYRAIKLGGTFPGIAAKVVDDLQDLIGVEGQEGTIDATKYGVQYSGETWPDWHTAKKLLDDAQASGKQGEYEDALYVFDVADRRLGSLMDQLNDLRDFRRVFDSID
jgi:hypothetical protein